MDIALQTVRDILRRSLGPDAFAAAFIERITPDLAVQTACIDGNGETRFNPDFARRYIRTDVDLFCLLFHELLHPAFGHFVHPDDDVANLACDAIINSAITHLFAEQSGSGSLFVRLYPERGLPGLLRPASEVRNSSYSALYRDLYPQTHSGRILSAGEVIQALKVLTPEMPPKMLLLGSHADRGSGGSAKNGIPAESAAKIANELLQAVAQAGSGAGYCDCLQKLVIEVLKQKQTVREELLARYASRCVLGCFFGEKRTPRRITSPFPVNPSRRDLVLLGAGLWPGLFRNRQIEHRRENKGVPIFLDVSGSVNEHLPAIVGLLTHYRNRIRSVYLFSNAVREVPFDMLCAGRLSTTYGTDFNCVARAISERGYDRAVVLTDGYASLDDDHAQLLGEDRPSILTILFGAKTDCPELAPFGDVVQLADVIE